MKQTFLTHTPQETESLGAHLAKSISSGLIALYGDLGAGKTLFVRGFVGAFLPSARVSSPTYTVMNCYADLVYHMDLYRIQDEADLESVGFYDIDPDALILCEWSEHLPVDIRPDVSIRIEKQDESTRRIIVETYADISF